MASHDKRNTRSTWDAVEVGGGEDGVDGADDSRPGERGKKRARAVGSTEAS